ncbi:chaperonin 10-like protein [Aspergillus bertholletiae]|uniref:Chaperonin 10-like protein n=1 Tax=Aspergillus bertholletiae TaxID=1226010 RepID=A0A5N7BJR0_9EURO|nr:chaperonin 10-like protein [Aspergillus bertholletiae]
MNAVGVEQYGPVENLICRKIPKPDKPQGNQLLIKVEAAAVNPIDTKVRNGTYDDAPDYYTFVPRPFHIMGYDGAGTVEDVGPECTKFKPGDQVFYVSSPTKQGAYCEYQVVSEATVGHKPKSLDFVEAAAMPLTYGTAYESLVERLEIKKGEKVGILIINGAGGVGAMASQIARWVLDLPVVITTASRPETIDFTKKMGATHVINHRKNLKKQIDELRLEMPIKYVFITHSTAQYLDVCSDIIAPLGKVCSIVQSADINMYGTQFMSKSLTFVWCWLGSKSYHGVESDQGEMLEQLSALIDAGKIKCHLTRRLKLDLDGVKEAHRIVESGKAIGKVALGFSEGVQA